MKVTIGKYRRWIGPYQLVSPLKYLGLSEDTLDKVGNWLSDTWVQGVCVWVEENKKRDIDIHIDGYDMWGMDHTLALIILPMLKKLKHMKAGAPAVELEDVPDYLHPSVVSEQWGTDKFWFSRWDYVVGEMIFAFEHIVDSDWEYEDPDNYMETSKRVNRGLELFGKYYRGLWT